MEFPEKLFAQLVEAVWSQVGNDLEAYELPTKKTVFDAIIAGHLDSAFAEHASRLDAMASVLECHRSAFAPSDLSYLLIVLALYRGSELAKQMAQLSDETEPAPNFGRQYLAHQLDENHELWETLRRYNDKLLHPIAPFIQAWFERKPKTTPRQYGAGFISSRLAANERNTRAFGLPARMERTEAEHIVLPGFGSDRRMPALPEELLALGKVRSGGRGAQLPIRATLAGIEFAPPHSRNAFYTMPVRDFLNRLYPKGYPRGKRWQADLARVAEAQAGARVPYLDPDTGQSGSTIPIMIMRIPGNIDGDLRIAVDLPPKSDQGAPITDNLYAYGASDSRAFYALLQLTVDWWQPGKTRVPVSKRRGIWTQLTDTKKRAHMERYEPYDRKQIIELTAPLTTKRNQREAYRRGIETLHRLHTAGEIILLPDGDGSWRIRPPPED